MDKTKTIFLLGGALALASGAYYYISEQEKKKREQFEKEKQEFFKHHPIKDIEEALHELKIQLYPLFFSIASMHKVYLDKEIAKTKDNPDKVKDYIHEILLAEFTKMVKSKEKLIYSKYKLNYEDVDLALNKYYKLEKDIQGIYKFILQNVQNCTKGIPPSLNISNSTLQFLNQEKVSNTWQRIQINNGKKLVRFYNGLKQQGVKDLTLDNEIVFQGICNLNLVQDRNFILQLEGLDYIESEDQNYKESAMDILQKCCQYYKEKSNEFAEQISQMEDIHENLVMLAMDANQDINEDDVEKLYKTLGQKS